MNSMKTAKKGSSVTISYIGTLDDGRIFHSTMEGGPVTLTLGNDEIFPAFEQAIIGMKTGETKNIVLPAESAYGPRQQENIIIVPRSSFPAGKTVAIGQKVAIEFRGGVSKVMLVIGEDGAEVTLDGNHPLAGMELTFALKVEAVD